MSCFGGATTSRFGGKHPKLSVVAGKKTTILKAGEKRPSRLERVSSNNFEEFTRRIGVAKDIILDLKRNTRRLIEECVAFPQLADSEELKTALRAAKALVEDAEKHLERRDSDQKSRQTCGPQISVPTISTLEMGGKETHSSAPVLPRATLFAPLAKVRSTTGFIRSPIPLVRPPISVTPQRAVSPLPLFRPPDRLSPAPISLAVTPRMMTNPAISPRMTTNIATTPRVPVLSPDQFVTLQSPMYVRRSSSSPPVASVCTPGSRSTTSPQCAQGAREFQTLTGARSPRRSTNSLVITSPRSSPCAEPERTPVITDLPDESANYDQYLSDLREVLKLTEQQVTTEAQRRKELEKKCEEMQQRLGI